MDKFKPKEVTRHMLQVASLIHKPFWDVEVNYRNYVVHQILRNRKLKQLREEGYKGSSYSDAVVDYDRSNPFITQH